MQSRSSYGVGGSTIAAACGISRYQTRFGLWLTATGRAPAFAGNVHTRLGQLCEPRARQLYADATGHDIAIPPASEFHAEHAWARATPDGRRVDDAGYLVQIKCVGYFVGRRWRYELPVEVLSQCQWEMFVTGAHTNDLAVLVGSDELEWERFMLGDLDDPREIFERATLEIFTIHRSDDDIEVLKAGALAFMDLVERDEQPPIDESPACAAWLTRRATKAGVTLEYDRAADLVERWHAAHDVARQAARDLDLAKNLIRERMGAAGATRIDTPAGPVLWTATKNGGAQLRSPAGWSTEDQ